MERMATFGRDPFANTADTDAYVPRTATEFVLVELETALRDGARVLWLAGPAGSGKTLLLRVLEERLAGDFSSLRVPYSKLDPDEFCQWALDALNQEPAADGERALAARITRGAAMGDPPLVWMIDDADLLPISTLQTLLRLQHDTGNTLRLLLASSDELPAEELARAGVMPVRVDLEGEMDSDEMAQYVRARLDHAGADPRQRAEIEAALDRLYARSRGNPGRLHEAAATLLCFGPDRLRAPVEPERVDPPERGVVPEVAVEAETAERVSIESLVAEAVAAEPPEELAVPATAAAPTTALVAPAEPAPAAEPPAIPSPGAARPPVPRKRIRRRRLGRR
jgi:type II secretory pathway predicted ATPase ExeA